MSSSQWLLLGLLRSAPAAAREVLTIEGEISMQSTIRVFKLDEVKRGTSSKTGKPYEIHTAQCALIDDNGNVDQVGTLDIPPDLRGKVQQGLYRGSFALKTNFQNGRIESALTGLTLVPEAGAARAPAAGAKA
jgi:hypothetical protein